MFRSSFLTGVSTGKWVLGKARAQGRYCTCSPTQNEKLSRNETQMDADRSLRLARALRNATQLTDTLFGNDVRTAYQLLARVLLHESGQQGFELAATRDANFHEVGGQRAESPVGSPARLGSAAGSGVRSGLGDGPGPLGLGTVLMPRVPRARRHLSRVSPGQDGDQQNVHQCQERCGRGTDLAVTLKTAGH